ncbi:hypothetical protein HDU83_005919 [Entophlyctis luteolus]|nr:hypothetical protein HDU83_005919 [Entophlyctis luteolus]
MAAVSNTLSLPTPRTSSATSDSSAVSTPSAIGAVTTASMPAQIIVPPELAKLATGKNGGSLYANLDSESKARIAVAKAFGLSSSKLLGTYNVIRIVGFGSNGAVLAGTLDAKAVAIKIIYKARASAKVQRVPSEIAVLKQLNSISTTSPESNLLRYVDDWQDSHHFYLVTELFGSDWLAAAATSGASSDTMLPLNFQAVFNGHTTSISLGFSAGSSDLWAWAYAHRAYVWTVSNHEHSYLPIQPVKHIIRQTAAAIAEMHAQGFYHGDIKVENILVQSEQAPAGAATPALPRVRLADFGHAKHISQGIASYGTQEVSPPELLHDAPVPAEHLDGRGADVFALGIVLFMLLNESGELPRIVKAIKSGIFGYEALLNEDSGYFPFDNLSDVDADGVALLDGMCMVDPARRLTIEQVLAHPWLAD